MLSVTNPIFRVKSKNRRLRATTSFISRMPSNLHPNTLVSIEQRCRSLAEKSICLLSGLTLFTVRVCISFNLTDLYGFKGYVLGGILGTKPLVIRYINACFLEIIRLTELKFGVLHISPNSYIIF